MTILSAMLIILLSLHGKAKGAMKAGEVLSTLHLLSLSDRRIGWIAGRWRGGVCEWKESSGPLESLNVVRTGVHEADFCFYWYSNVHILIFGRDACFFSPLL